MFTVIILYNPVMTHNITNQLDSYYLCHKTGKVIYVRRQILEM